MLDDHIISDCMDQSGYSFFHLNHILYIHTNMYTYSLSPMFASLYNVISEYNFIYQYQIRAYYEYASLANENMFKHGSDVVTFCKFNSTQKINIVKYNVSLNKFDNIISSLESSYTEMLLKFIKSYMDLSIYYKNLDHVS